MRDREGMREGGGARDCSKEGSRGGVRDREGMKERAEAREGPREKDRGREGLGTADMDCRVDHVLVHSGSHNLGQDGARGRGGNEPSCKTRDGDARLDADARFAVQWPSTIDGHRDGHLQRDRHRDKARDRDMDKSGSKTKSSDREIVRGSERMKVANNDLQRTKGEGQHLDRGSAKPRDDHTARDATRPKDANDLKDRKRPRDEYRLRVKHGHRDPDRVVDTCKPRQGKGRSRDEERPSITRWVLDADETARPRIHNRRKKMTEHPRLTADAGSRGEDEVSSSLSLSTNVPIPVPKAKGRRKCFGIGRCHRAAAGCPATVGVLRGCQLAAVALPNQVSVVSKVVNSHRTPACNSSSLLDVGHQGGGGGGGIVHT